jgi:hypothetical protein
MLERPLELGDEVYYNKQILPLERVTKTQAVFILGPWEYHCMRDTGLIVGTGGGWHREHVKLVTPAFREQLAAREAAEEKRCRLADLVVHLRSLSTRATDEAALQEAIAVLERADKGVGGQGEDL